MSNKAKKNGRKAKVRVRSRELRGGSVVMSIGLYPQKGRRGLARSGRN